MSKASASQSPYLKRVRAAAKAGDVDLFETVLRAWVSSLPLSSLSRTPATSEGVRRVIRDIISNTSAAVAAAAVPMLRALTKTTILDSTPTEFMYNEALRRGRFDDVLRWLATEYPNEALQKHIFVQAVRRNAAGDYEAVVRALVDRARFVISPAVFSYVANYCRLPAPEFVVWMAERAGEGCRKELHFASILRLDLDTLETLCEKLGCTLNLSIRWSRKKYYELLVAAGRFDLLQWLHDKGHYAAAAATVTAAGHESFLESNSICVGSVLLGSSGGCSGGPYGLLVWLYETARMPITCAYGLSGLEDVADADCREFWREYGRLWCAGQFVPLPPPVKPAVRRGAVTTEPAEDRPAEGKIESNE